MISWYHHLILFYLKYNYKRCIFLFDLLHFPIITNNSIIWSWTVFKLNAIYRMGWNPVNQYLGVIWKIISRNCKFFQPGSGVFYYIPWRSGGEWLRNWGCIVLVTARTWYFSLNSSSSSSSSSVIDSLVSREEKYSSQQIKLLTNISHTSFVSTSGFYKTTLVK